ncbi:MAG: hypothetical protein KAW61_03685, partial [candidate division Zixibacteria bacterium]|nr:hypothetical protein [candidate division Zixibacteria bacterium]
MERIKRVMGHLALLGGVMLLISASSPGLQAGFVDHVEFECDAVVEVFGEPKLGEPFEVEFRFTPLAEIKHERGVPDSAYLRAREEGVSYVGGDTLWVGLLETGQTYSMRATFVCNAEIRFRVKGLVRAREVVGIVGPPGATTAAFGGTCSRLLDFRVNPPPDGFSFDSYDAVMTDSGVVVLDSMPWNQRHWVDPEEVNRRRWERLKAQESESDIPRTRHPGGGKQKISFRTNEVTLTLEKLLALDTILLYWKGFNLISLGEQIRNLKILNDSSFRLDRSGSGSFRLDVLQPDSTLEIQLDDSTYVLPVRYLYEWELSGRVSYVDNDSTIQLSKYVIVELYEWDDEWGGYLFSLAENTTEQG